MGIGNVLAENLFKTVGRTTVADEAAKTVTKEAADAMPKMVGDSFKATPFNPDTYVPTIGRITEVAGSSYVNSLRATGLTDNQICQELKNLPAYWPKDVSKAMDQQSAATLAANDAAQTKEIDAQFKGQFGPILGTVLAKPLEGFGKIMERVFGD